MFNFYFLILLINPSEPLQTIEKDTSFLVEAIENQNRNQKSLLYNMNIFIKPNISDFNSVLNEYTDHAKTSAKLDVNVSTNDDIFIPTLFVQQQDKREAKHIRRNDNQNATWGETVYKIPGSIDKINLSELNRDHHNAKTNKNLSTTGYHPEGTVLRNNFRTKNNKTTHAWHDKFYSARQPKDTKSKWMWNKLNSLQTVMKTKKIELPPNVEYILKRFQKNSYPWYIADFIVKSKSSSDNNEENLGKPTVFYRERNKKYSSRLKLTQHSYFPLVNHSESVIETPLTSRNANNTVITVNNVVNEFIIIPAIDNELQSKTSPLVENVLTYTANEEWPMVNFTVKPSAENTMGINSDNDVNLDLDNKWVAVNLEMEPYFKPQLQENKLIREQRDIFIETTPFNIAMVYKGKVENNSNKLVEVSTTCPASLEHKYKMKNKTLEQMVAKEKRNIDLTALDETLLLGATNGHVLINKGLLWGDSGISKANKKITNRPMIMRHKRNNAKSAIPFNLPSLIEFQQYGKPREVETLREPNKHGLNNPAHKYEYRYLQETLFKKIRVFCLVMVYENKGSAERVRQTWGKRCNSMLFINPSQGNSPDITGSGRKCWGKVKSALKHVHDNYFNEADWILKANVDDYVIMENLRYMLADYNTEDPLFFGCRMKFNSILPQKNSGTYVISKAALRRLVKNGHNPSFCDAIKSDSEDILMANCLDNLGVKSVDTRDEYNRTRFFPADFYESYTYDEPSYSKYLEYPQKKGLDCCSDYPIAFRSMSPDNIFLAELLIYHVRPYGIDYVNENIPNVLAGKPVIRIQENEENNLKNKPNSKTGETFEQDENPVMTGGFYRANIIGDLINSNIHGTKEPMRRELFDN